MKLLRKINAALFDSPTFGRDRANLISGFTIGSAGLLLNGAIMCFVMPLLFDPDDEWFRQVTEGIGFGQTLALILLGGATILATLLIPLRLVSVFWGPRIGRYFDQIVLSGISPTRFCARESAVAEPVPGPHRVSAASVHGSVCDAWRARFGFVLRWRLCALAVLHGVGVDHALVVALRE